MSGHKKLYTKRAKRHIKSTRFGLPPMHRIELSLEVTGTGLTWCECLPTIWRKAAFPPWWGCSPLMSRWSWPVKRKFSFWSLNKSFKDEAAALWWADDPYLVWLASELLYSRQHQPNHLEKREYRRCLKMTKSEYRMCLKNDEVGKQEMP